jgi:hypothetical protein
MRVTNLVKREYAGNASERRASLEKGEATPMTPSGKADAGLNAEKPTAEHRPAAVSQWRI